MTKLIKTALYVLLLFAVFEAVPVASGPYEEYAAAWTRAGKAAIGKRFWLALPKQSREVHFCPSSVDQFDKCKWVHDGSFVVLAVVGKRIGPDSMLHVRFDDGRSGYIATNALGRFLREDPKITQQKELERKKAAIQECERRGQPQIGMTRGEAVATCWGYPLKTHRIKTRDHTREQLIYGVDRFLEFEDGKLKSIHESE